MKKYNNQTGCYKIDIFLNGKYVCSTDQSKTCKQAKEKYLKHYPNTKGKLTAHFYKH
jgi:hypothetical protein